MTAESCRSKTFVLWPYLCVGGKKGTWHSKLHLKRTTMCNRVCITKPQTWFSVVCFHVFLSATNFVFASCETYRNEKGTGFTLGCCFSTILNEFRFLVEFLIGHFILKVMFSFDLDLCGESLSKISAVSVFLEANHHSIITHLITLDKKTLK